MPPFASFISHWGVFHLKKIMKKLLKKLKESWLDYLIIFISVGAICFVYLFTAFYQFKESDKNINKENIVKVLRDKKNAQHDNFTSEKSAFYIGNMSRYNSNNTFIEFYLNIVRINFSLDNDLPIDNLEIEFEYYITADVKYLDNVGMQVEATFNPTSSQLDTYSMTTQAFNSIQDIEFVEMYLNMESLRYEGGYVEEEIYFDFEIMFDIRFVLNDELNPDHDFLFEDIYSSFGIDATNLPVSVRQEINNNIFEDINDIRANTSVRDFRIYFNTTYSGFNFGYQDGYDDGHFEGYNEGFSYGEELGYNNGYNDGVIAGSNNFNILNLIRSLFDMLWDALNVEMLPNIKLIYIVSIPLILNVIEFILGWFR